MAVHTLERQLPFAFRCYSQTGLGILVAISSIGGSKLPGSKGSTHPERTGFRKVVEMVQFDEPGILEPVSCQTSIRPPKTRVLYNEGPRFITTGQAGGGIDGAASIDFGALQGSVDRLARPTIRPESYLAAPKSREPIRNAIRPLKKSFRWPWISSSAASSSSAATRAR